MNAEELLNKIANEESYETWFQLMYDTHAGYQLDVTIRALEEYHQSKLIEIRKEIENCQSGLDFGKTKEAKENNDYLSGMERAIEILDKYIKP